MFITFYTFSYVFFVYILYIFLICCTHFCMFFHMLIYGLNFQHFNTSLPTCFTKMWVPCVNNWMKPGSSNPVHTEPRVKNSKDLLIC